MTGRKLLREAMATARAARGFSLFFALIAFLAVAIVVLLAGQADAQRVDVLTTFSRAEYRTVEVIDDQELGVISQDAVRLATRFTDVERVWASGPAFEVVNPAFPERGRVSARALAGDWSGLPIMLTSGRLPNGPGEALASTSSADTLGIDATGGSVATSEGLEWALVGTYLPRHDRAPSTVLVPADAETKIRSLSFTVTRLEQVESVATGVMSIAGATRPGQLVVDRATDAGRLNATVTGTVREYGVTIVVTTMVTSMAVLTLISALMVHSRRQEFGRRRALGATRTTIIALVMLHGSLVVLSAGLIGSVAGAALTWVQFGRTPAASFMLAILITTVCGSALAQVPSAVVAGMRDPVRVLRTP